MKKIALFSDGTGNSSSNPHKTNVWRTYKALDLSNSSKQVAYYDNGVGTSSFAPMAILGLAFGFGLARNVKQIYKFLCRKYDKDDEIYCFGFSRGAFTIRVVASLIASQGVIDRHKYKGEKDLDRLVNAAYRQFRKNNFTPSLLSLFGVWIRDLIIAVYEKITGRTSYDNHKNLNFIDSGESLPNAFGFIWKSFVSLFKFANNKNTEPKAKISSARQEIIKFIGVWDTVDAYGFPIDELARAWDMVVWPLQAKDRNLSNRVSAAYHALALDEQRKSFEPMLWNEKNEETDRVVQVWFPGVHTNVGGGYPDDSLAYEPLHWVMNASKQNLGLTYAHMPAVPNQNMESMMNNSRKGIATLYRYQPRHIKSLCDQSNPGLANWLKKWTCRPIENLLMKFQAISSRIRPFRINNNVVNVSNPKIHHSVFHRIENAGHGYAPINIPDVYGMMDSSAVVHTLQTTAQPNLFPETPDEIGYRSPAQINLWRRVWGRAIMQYIGFLVLGLFALFPSQGGDGENFMPNFIIKIADELRVYLGTFADILLLIPQNIGKIPGLGVLESWAISYSEYPVVFAIFAVAIYGIYKLNTGTEKNITHSMRQIWHYKYADPSNVDISNPAKISAFAKFLESSSVYRFLSSRWHALLELSALLIFLLLVVALFSRLTFVTLDAFGGICENKDSFERLGVNNSKIVDFNPRNPCNPTGVRVDKGEVYEVTFEINKISGKPDTEKLDYVWKDSGLEADLGGLKDSALTMALFSPLRRHMAVDWFQPIVRIGEKKLDRYPMVTDKEKALSNDKIISLKNKITTRSSGELFLYLNDAVFFKFPKDDENETYKDRDNCDLFDFYCNNHGEGSVIIKRVAVESESESS